MKDKKKVLVIGGTGFVGYHLIKRLIEFNWNVDSISSRKPRKKRYLKKVRYLVCNITNYNLLQKKIDRHYDYVINLGGYVNHSDIKKTYNSHYLGCKNISKIFFNKNIKSFIQIGSSAEYGKSKSPQKENFICNPKSIYGRAKLMATEHLLKLNKKYKFPCTILRLYQAYGPYQDPNRLISFTIENCLNNRKFPCSDGLQYRDFIYIDDVVDAIIKCLKNKKASGEIFNVGSGKPEQVIKLIKKINFKIKKGTPIFGKIKLRNDESLKIYPNINKIKNFINWKPKTTLEKGLLKTINYYGK